MRRAKVYNHGRLAGVLEELDDGTFLFQYDSSYLADPDTSAVSLTLPKRAEAYRSDELFAFFYGLLSEGSTRRMQSQLLRIDEDDAFGLLAATARDAIGSVTLGPDDQGSG